MEIFALQASLGLNNKEYKDKIDESKGMIGTFANFATSSASKIAGSIADTVKAIGSGIVSFGKESMDTGKAFDSSMSQLAATMGTTVDKIGLLEETAQKMGATTKYTAKEAADGLNILAMAGLEAKDQVAAISTVLDFASAGGMTLEASASAIAGSVKGFGDSMEHAQYYADMIAKGATMANTDVSNFGAAMGDAAASASAYGQSADSVALSLLKLAESNVTGTAASTALGAAYKGLYAPTKDAQKALKSLGVSAFDSKGKAKDFNVVMEEMNKKLSKMSDKQQAEYLSRIFGVQGMDAYNKMVAVSTEKTQEFVDGLAHAEGSAAQQAATQLDNLEGDITLFGSALDGLKLMFYKSFDDIAREVVKFGTNFISAITDGFKADGITGAMVGIIAVIKGEIDKLSPIFAEWGAKLPNLIAENIEHASSVLGPMFSVILENIKGLIAEYAPTVVNVLLDVIGNIGKFVADNASTILEIGKTIITSIASGIAERFDSIKEKAAEIVGKIKDTIVEHIPGLLEKGKEIVSNIRDGIAGKLSLLVENGKEIIPKVIEGIAAKVQDLVEQGRSMIPKIKEGITEKLSDLVERGKTIVSNVVSGIAQKMPDILSKGAAIIDNIKSGITAKITTLATNAKEIVDTIVKKIKGEDWVARGKNLLNDIVNGIGNVMKNLTKKAQEIVSEIADKIRDAGWLEKGQNILNNIITGISNIIPQLPGKAQEIISNIADKIRDAGWIEKGQDILNNIITGITNMLSNLVSSSTDIVNSITEKINDFDWEKAGQNVVQFIVNGIQAFIHKVTEAATWIVDTIKDMLGNKSGQRGTDWNGLGVAIVEFIGSGMSGAVTAIASAVRTVGQNIIDYFTQIDWIGIGKSILDWILSGLTGLGEAVSNSLSDAMAGYDSWVNEQQKKQTVVNAIDKVDNAASKLTSKLGNTGSKNSTSVSTSSGFSLGSIVSSISSKPKSALEYNASTSYTATPVPVAQSSGNNTTLGGVTINVNGANYSNEQSMAEAIADSLQNMMDRRAAVYA